MQKLKYAIALAAALLISNSAPASALPEGSVRCEFMLSNQEGAHLLAPAFRGILQMLKRTTEIEVNDAATPLTWARLGFERPLADPQLSIEFDRRGEDLFWLILKDQTTSKRFAVHTPPLHVWRALPPSDYISPQTLDLNSEELENLNVGVLVRSVGQDRIFISLDEMRPDWVTLSFGLDVPCEKASLFTGQFTPAIILTADVGYCRIRVVQASFVPERAQR